MTDHPLLIDDKDLILLRSKLAVLVGLNEAIVIQQLHYWNGINERSKKHDTHYFDGHWWVYNTWRQWRDDNFPFWSTRTIKRTFDSVVNSGLVLRQQHDNQQKGHWFALLYDELDKLGPDKLPPLENEGHDNLSPLDAATPDNLSPLPGQVVTLIGNTETTTETTKQRVTPPRNHYKFTLPHNTKHSDGKPVDVLTAGIEVNNIFHAWLEALAAAGRAFTGNREQAFREAVPHLKALLINRIYEDAVTEYMAHILADNFWSDKTPGLRYIANNIGAWLSKSSTNGSPTYAPITIEDDGEVATAEERAAIRAAMEAE